MKEDTIYSDLVGFITLRDLFLRVFMRVLIIILG